MEDKEENTSDKSIKTPPPQMWRCPICGSCVWNSNRNRHLRTKKHLDAQYVLTEKFEIIQ